MPIKKYFLNFGREKPQQFHLRVLKNRLYLFIRSPPKKTNDLLLIKNLSKDSYQTVIILFNL